MVYERGRGLGVHEGGREGGREDGGEVSRSPSVHSH